MFRWTKVARGLGMVTGAGAAVLGMVTISQASSGAGDSERPQLMTIGKVTMRVSQPLRRETVRQSSDRRIDSNARFTHFGKMIIQTTDADYPVTPLPAAPSLSSGGTFVQRGKATVWKPR